MSGTSPEAGEVAELRAANQSLRAANARLRQLLEDKDAQIAALTAQLEELRSRSRTWRRG